MPLHVVPQQIGNTSPLACLQFCTSTLPSDQGHHRQPGSALGAEDGRSCNSIPASYFSRQRMPFCRRADLTGMQ